MGFLGFSGALWRDLGILPRRKAAPLRRCPFDSAQEFCLRSLSDLYARAQDSPELIPPAAPQPPFDNQIRRTLDQPSFERPAVRTAPAPLLTAVFSSGGFRTPAHLVDSKSVARQDPQAGRSDGVWDNPVL